LIENLIFHEQDYDSLGFNYELIELELFMHDLVGKTTCAMYTEIEVLDDIEFELIGSEVDMR